MFSVQSAARQKIGARDYWLMLNNHCRTSVSIPKRTFHNYWFPPNVDHRIIFSRESSIDIFFSEFVDCSVVFKYSEKTLPRVWTIAYFVKNKNDRSTLLGITKKNIYARPTFWQFKNPLKTRRSTVDPAILKKSCFDSYLSANCYFWRVPWICGSFL